MKYATDSQMAMFRGAIALAWADGALDPQEIGQLETFIRNNIHLSDAQKRQLLADIQSHVRLEDVWGAITDKHDRAHLINIADLIFWKDGAFCHNEREVYEKIQADHLKNLDTDTLEKDLSALAQQARTQWAKDEREMVEDFKMPYSKAFYYLEKKLGI